MCIALPGPVRRAGVCTGQDVHPPEGPWFHVSFQPPQLLSSIGASVGDAGILSSNRVPCASPGVWPGLGYLCQPRGQPGLGSGVCTCCQPRSGDWEVLSGNALRSPAVCGFRSPVQYSLLALYIHIVTHLPSYVQYGALTFSGHPEGEQRLTCSASLFWEYSAAQRRCAAFRSSASARRRPSTASCSERRAAA